MPKTTESPGAVVKRLREAQGLTQAELARLSGVGQGYISRLERGERAATWAALRKLCASLGCSLAVFDGAGEG
jgi:transcriptional regulator with XRE-family HTH domain